MKAFDHLRAASWLVLLCVSAGCGGPASISGIILLDGQPLDGAVVVLNPETPDTELVVGTTGADGRFRVTASAAASIRPGTYRVTVSKRGLPPEPKTPVPAPPDPNFPGAGAAGLGPLALPPELIPAKYSELAQTTLSVTVPLRGELALELASE